MSALIEHSRILKCASTCNLICGDNIVLVEVHKKKSGFTEICSWKTEAYFKSFQILWILFLDTVPKHGK